jgi:hypothetical protein
MSNILSVVATNIYYASQVIAGLSGFIIFYLAYKFDGTDTRSGNTILAGSGLLKAIMIGYLAVAPLFFEQVIHGPEFPTPTFHNKFWFFVVLELLMGIAGINMKKSRVRSFELLYIPLAMIGASWSSKTIELMFFVFQDSQISIILKIVYEMLGAAFGVLYFLSPLLFYNFLKKTFTERSLNIMQPSFAALREGEQTGRVAAVNAVADLIDRSQVVDPALFYDQVRKHYFEERDFKVREQIRKRFSKADMQFSADNILYWDAFQDKEAPDMLHGNSIKPSDCRWPVDGRQYYYDERGFNFDKETDGWSWINMNVEKLPDKFDIELVSIWKTGKDGSPFGLLLGLDKNNFLGFCISKNGHATAGQFQNQGYLKDLISWKPVAEIKATNNKITVQVRGRSVAYLVNGTRVGAFQNESFSYRTFGLIVGSQQAACFSLLKIIDKTGKSQANQKIS